MLNYNEIVRKINLVYLDNKVVANIVYTISLRINVPPRLSLWARAAPGSNVMSGPLTLIIVPEVELFIDARARYGTDNWLNLLSIRIFNSIWKFKKVLVDIVKNIFFSFCR